MKVFDDVEFLPDSEQYSSHVHRGVARPGDINCVVKHSRHGEIDNMFDLIDTPFAPLIPEFYGIWHRTGPKTGTKYDYIVFEDANRDFSSPCIADIKLGTRISDIHASKSVQTRLGKLSAETLSEKYGIRLMNGVKRGGHNILTQWHYDDGVEMSMKGVLYFFLDFLPDPLMKKVHDRLLYIRDTYLEMMHEYPGFRMYAGSCLITYDGDDLEKEPRVYLIDFAHTYIDISEDDFDVNDPENFDGVVRGLDTIIAYTAFSRTLE